MLPRRREELLLLVTTREDVLWLSGRPDNALVLLLSPADVPHLRGSRHPFQAINSRVAPAAARARW